MVEVKKLAEQILEFLHQEEEKHGHLNVTLASLYKKFESEASYDVIQNAVRFLSDRDSIAPFSYSLTAKGRREHSLRQKT
jgi:hypothetical protein